MSTKRADLFARSFNEFSCFLYLVYFSLDVRGVENLMSLVAARLLEEFLINLLDSWVLVRLTERH